MGGLPKKESDSEVGRESGLLHEKMTQSWEERVGSSSSDQKECSENFADTSLSDCRKSCRPRLIDRQKYTKKLKMKY